MFSPSRPAEGRWPSSRTLGRDAVDAAAPARLRRSQGGISVSDSRARRRTVLLRTVKSCGPDASKVGVKLVEVLRTRPGGQSLNPPMTVPKKPDRRGEHEISRKTIACGNAGRSRCDRGDYSCAFYPCTRGCGCIGHPAFPTPSFGRRINAQPGRIAPRECGVASPFVTACDKCEAFAQGSTPVRRIPPSGEGGCDEAIPHSSSPRKRGSSIPETPVGKSTGRGVLDRPAIGERKRRRPSDGYAGR
jgi:hypothetical protein